MVLLFELQQIGLVQKNLTVPVSYVAVPFPEAVKALFEEKTSELTLVSQKAKWLTEKFSHNPPVIAIPESNPTPCTIYK